MFTVFAINPIMIIAAVAPAVILMVRVYKLDQLEREPVGMLIRLVILGMISTIPAMILELIGTNILNALFPSESTIYLFLMYFGVVAFAEEGCKYFFLKKGSWKSREFNCRFDGIVYAVFTALGFALLENILYVAQFGVGNALVRAVTAVPGHASFGIFMGVFYGLAKQAECRGAHGYASFYRKLAILFPAFMHGFYDFILSVSVAGATVIFVAYVVFMFLFAWKLIHRVEREDSYL